MAKAPTDEVAAVEQATEEIWVVHNALSQIAVVEEPTEEEGVAEAAKIMAVQEPTEEEAVAEDSEQEDNDEEDASDEEEQQLDLKTIGVENIDLSLLIKGKADCEYLESLTELEWEASLREHFERLKMRLT